VEGLFSQQDFDTIVTKRCTRTNDVLSKVHEAVAPKYTPSERKKFQTTEDDDDYGGITGTIVPSAFSLVVQGLMGLAIVRDGKTIGQLDGKFALQRHKSIFLDIGCGTGRPTLAVAGLPIKLSLGFDIDTLQIQNSIVGYRTMERDGVGVTTPVAFYRDNLYHLQSFNPVTHAYAFSGYEEFVFIIASVAARSSTLKALALVTPHDKVVRECGLFHPSMASSSTTSTTTSDDENDSLVGDVDVIELGGLAMSGNYRYKGFIFPMTRTRKDRVLEYEKNRKIGKSTTTTSSSTNTVELHDLNDTVQKCSTKEKCESLMEQELAKIQTQPKKRAAAKRALANITGGIGTTSSGSSSNNNND
jgi:hypothetical protein